MDAFAREDRLERLDYQPEVDLGTLDLGVADVELDPLVPCERVATRDLRQPGQAWLDGESAPLMIVVTLDLIGAAWVVDRRCSSRRPSDVDQLR
ncbi:MAG: hypothetical protein V9F03_05575 [Microthrixaceae bacterium]